MKNMFQKRKHGNKLTLSDVVSTITCCVFVDILVDIRIAHI